MQSLILKSCFGIRRKNWGFNYCRTGKYTILPLAAINHPEKFYFTFPNCRHTFFPADEK